MTFFILTLFQAGYKLRISTLYHLLVGKRTSSVLLHGFFYQNLAYYAALPTLKEKTFQEAIQTLTNKQLILVEEGFGRLTTQGKAALIEHPVDLSGLNGLRYGRMRENMWQLIVFAVQVTSYLSFNEKKYLPIENRPYYLQLVKQWLAQSDAELVTVFPQELQAVLQKIPQEQADFLANQFSGHEFQGKAGFQLLPEAWQTEPWNQLYQQQGIDRFLAELSTGNLARLVAELDQQNFNQSMLKTKEFFLAGKSIPEILRLRHLKQGTVNDHFVEWALLDPAFPFAAFETMGFKELTVEQVLAEKYQTYELPYLNFRLSQIHFIKEQTDGAN